MAILLGSESNLAQYLKIKWGYFMYVNKLMIGFFHSVTLNAQAAKVEGTFTAINLPNLSSVTKGHNPGIFTQFLQDIRNC